MKETGGVKHLKTKKKDNQENSQTRWNARERCEVKRVRSIRWFIQAASNVEIRVAIETRDNIAGVIYVVESQHRKIAYAKKERARNGRRGKTKKGVQRSSQFRTGCATRDNMKKSRDRYNRVWTCRDEHRKKRVNATNGQCNKVIVNRIGTS